MSRFAQRLRSAVGKGGVLYLSPMSGSYSGGSTVNVAIRMTSGSTLVNTVQANLTYPTAQLQFGSISTVGSPFTTTIQSNGGSGSVQLGVGILAGSTFGDQLVGVITFTATAAGAATVTFNAGSGIARTADAVDICTQKRGAAYTIT
ncbi:hypothetical protein IPL85_02565 [Candidatus Saccharibacteria bacterium]|nr:MAG: hypothetical protein IPL85_02565 [Candidatus Saccharibacteria bacterium]